LVPLTGGPGDVVIETHTPFADRLARFPFWLLLMLLGVAWVGLIVSVNEDYQAAFGFIRDGILTTLWVSLVAYVIAIAIGLLVGLGRVSSNFILYNISTFYVELVRGIPMLVLIFSIAFVAVPAATGLLSRIGIAVSNQNVSMVGRAIIALAVTYGAFLAEIFRAGIQSISKGQMEAARSLGMSYPQAMWYVILPQAVRNVLPALANDFVAMVKDSSLVSVLAVRDITQLARLYAGRTFQYSEAYVTLSMMYLVMTLGLSLLLRLVERGFRKSA
jgi:polar amino acid transport system permease protein